MRLPVLHLSVPNIPCALYVNGALLGQSADEPVLPVSPDGVVYITCLPMADANGTMALPLTVCFSLYNGLPNSAVYGCTLYIDAESVIDVRLSPTLLPQPLDEQPRTVSRVTFTHNRHPHAATLYHDSVWRIAIEDIAHDTLLVCHTIRDFTGGQVAAVRCFTSTDIHVTGQGQNGPRSLLFTPVDGQYALIADENTESVAGDHTLVCTGPLYDTAGHQMRYSITQDDKGSTRSNPVYGFFSTQATPLDTPAAVCTALCEALALSLWEETQSYLTAELRDGMTLTDLFDFFGPFDHVHAVTGAGPYTLTLAYTSYENVYCLQSYTCEMEGLLISNILPQE